MWLSPERWWWSRHTHTQKSTVGRLNTTLKSSPVRVRWETQWRKKKVTESFWAQFLAGLTNNEIDRRRIVVHREIFSKKNKVQVFGQKCACTNREITKAHHVVWSIINHDLNPPFCTKLTKKKITTPFTPKESPKNSLSLPQTSLQEQDRHWKCLRVCHSQSLIEN